MDDIPIPSGLTERLEALGVRRREALAGAAVVAGIVLAALLLLSRDAPAVIAPPATATSSPETAPGTGSAGAVASPAAAIYVHVAGFVRSPGLFGLPAGARVADAIEAAGGARSGADLDAVNLAQVLTDGLKIEVPRRGASASTTAPTATPGSGGDAATGGMVSINSADQAALEVIPGIGPVKAAAIVQYRTDNGAFSTVEQLLEVSGIGPATLEAIRPYISL
jgi:competence protein ComEA